MDLHHEEPRRPGRASRRWWWLAVPAGLVVVAAATAVLALRDPSDPVSVGTAVDRFRKGSAASAAGPAVPAGVYVYRTTGSASVDALKGSAHHYPARTTVTVRDAGGGCLDTRWDALAQRWDTERLCPAPSGGWSRRAATTFHSFFSQPETRRYTCRAADYVPPGGDRSGSATWRCDCRRSEHAGPTSETGERQVIGTGTVRVAGVARPALHVRYTATEAGATKGTATLDRWYSLDRFPLVLREAYRERTSSGTPIGVVHYDEDRTLTLAAWEPQR